MEQNLAWLESKLGERIPLGGTCSIGRSNTNMLVIPSDKVSRRHALLHRHNDGEFLIVDLGSSNGTFVNGRRVDHMTVLHEGDVIDIGPKKLIFRDGTEAAEDLASEDEAGANAAAVPCWLLVASTEHANLAKYEAPADSSFKTVTSWPIAFSGLVEQLGGSVVRQSDEDIFAFWTGEPESARRVVDALGRLQGLQTRARPQFRLSLHYAKVLVEEAASPHASPALEGAGVTFAFHLQKLAWRFSIPCVLSEPARAALEPIASARQVEIEGGSSLPLFAL